MFSQREIRIYVYLLTSIQEMTFCTSNTSYQWMQFFEAIKCSLFNVENICKLRSLECKRLGEFRYTSNFSEIQDENINIYTFP